MRGGSQPSWRASEGTCPWGHQEEPESHHTAPLDSAVQVGVLSPRTGVRSESRTR